MGRPNYWPGPVVTSLKRGAAILSFDQGLVLLKTLNKRIQELKIEIEEAGGLYAPNYLHVQLEEVTGLFDMLEPVENDEGFGDQFIEIYRKYSEPLPDWWGKL